MHAVITNFVPENGIVIVTGVLVSLLPAELTQ